jgi:hypothetical protein
LVIIYVITDFEKPSANRGTEYCGKVEQHELRRCVAVNSSGPRPSRRRPAGSASASTKLLNEFYQVTFRKKIYATIEELRGAL